MAKRRASDPYGILLVDKPPGCTSHDVVGWVRWVLRGVPAGHCGTLDPAASGLLVVGVGAATRLTHYLSDDDKTYRATFVLGRSTTTADGAGETLEVRSCGAPELEAVREAVATLEGAHALAPPAYSAIKVAGRRAHAMARRGESPELAPRPMTVHDLALERVEAIDSDCIEVQLRLRVSKGTYIRSLAEALGQRVGVPAHLGTLRRLRSGVFDVDAPDVVTGLYVSAVPGTGTVGKPKTRLRWPEPETDRDDAAPPLLERMRPAVASLPFPGVALDPTVLLRLFRGQPRPLVGSVPTSERVAVVDAAGSEALLIARVDASTMPPLLRPERTIIPFARPPSPEPTDAPQALGSSATDDRSLPPLDIGAHGEDSPPTNPKSKKTNAPGA